jgi:hypothetical protein
MRRPQKQSSNDPTRNQDHIPLSRDHIDVVISNCVINLSADKPWSHQRACCPGPRPQTSGGGIAAGVRSAARCDRRYPPNPV